MKPLASLALALLVLAPAAYAKGLSGEVIVRTIGEDRVAVLIDSNGDQKIDQGFLLTSDLPVPAMKLHFESAKVEYTDAYVRIGAGEKMYDLHVAGHPEPPAAPKDLKPLRFIGYALQHSTGESRCSMAEARDGDAGACYSYGEK